MPENRWVRITLLTALLLLAGLAVSAALLLSSEADDEDHGLESLRALIPPELRREQHPLPETGNAYDYWQRAETLLRPAEGQHLQELLRQCRVRGEALPTGAAMQRVEAHLRGNAAALALLEQSLEQPRLVLPFDDEATQVGGLREGLRLWELQAMIALKRGRPAAAWAAWQHLLAAVALLRSAERGLADDLIAIRLLMVASYGLRELLATDQLAPALLEDIVAELASCDAACQRDFSRLLPRQAAEFARRLARTPSAGGAFAKHHAEHVEHMLREVWGTTPAALPEHRFFELFGRKGQVLDRAATMREACTILVQMRAHESDPWPRLRNWLRGPASRGRRIHDRVGPALRAIDPMGGILHGMMDAGGEGLAAAERRLVELLEESDNVVGLLLLAYAFGPETWLVYLEDDTEALARLRLLRFAFALRLAAARGTDPTDVRKPDDPFGTGPLHYDAQRRLVWSVGPDGEDDGGSFDERAFSSKSADVVLELP